MYKGYNVYLVVRSGFCVMEYKFDLFNKKFKNLIHVIRKKSIRHKLSLSINNYHSHNFLIKQKFTLLIFNNVKSYVKKYKFGFFHGKTKRFYHFNRKVIWSLN